MNSDLLPYYINLELINETANQIIKDFSLFGAEITLSGNAANTYDELFDQINPFIAKLIDSNYQKLLEVLYRIDVSETQVAGAVKEKKIAEAITKLIIRRELQKVVTRKFFSGK